MGPDPARVDAWQQRCLPATEEFCSKVAGPAMKPAGPWEPVGPTLVQDGALWVMWRRPLCRIVPKMVGPTDEGGAS